MKLSFLATSLLGLGAAGTVPSYTNNIQRIFGGTPVNIKTSDPEVVVSSKVP